MKKLLLLMFVPILGISQVQIGSNINGEAAGDQAGTSVSLSNDGTILAVGAQLNDGNGSAAGHVRIYKNVSGTWTQVGADIDGESAGDYSGWASDLSADGSIVAIGSLLNAGNGSQSGSVRVFKNVSGTWTKEGADIDGASAGDQFGFPVSLSADGSILAAGALKSNGNGNDSGQVRIFKNVSGTWTQIGSNINGEFAGDQFGFSIDLSADGSIVAIGSKLNDGNGSNSGSVRVFKNVSGTWTQEGADIDGKVAGDQSGNALSLSADGSILAIGSWLNDGNGTDSGQVRIFKNVSGTWTQVGADINGKTVGEQTGHSVKLSADGSKLGFGARLHDENGTNAGHARLYENMAGTWTQVGNDIVGASSPDQLGFSVGLSADGTILAAGSPFSAANGTSSGTAGVYDFTIVLSSDSFVLENFSMSPNPTNDFVTINLTQGLELKQVNIYNYFGQKVQTTQSTKVDLSAFSSGIYLLEVETNKGKASKKIVKK